MIKLDEYDTQILLLSKCHFDDVLKADRSTDGKGLNRIDALKAIWAWRCGVSLEHVPTGYLLGHLVKILEKLGELNSRNVIDLLDSACHYPKGNWKLGTNRKDIDMVETLIYACLGKLSVLQVQESVEVDGEMIYEPLIELCEKDDSFLKVFDEKKEEGFYQTPQILRDTKRFFADKATFMEKLFADTAV